MYQSNAKHSGTYMELNVRLCQLWFWLHTSRQSWASEKNRQGLQVARLKGSHSTSYQGKVIGRSSNLFDGMNFGLGGENLGRVL